MQIRNARERSWIPLRAVRYLSRKLGVNYNLLLNIVKESKQTSNSLYRVKIIMRNGKKRKLYIPNQPLMEIQRKINKRILAKFSRSPNAFGFSGGSILEAIVPHLGASAIWSCDIKDAFASTFQERVFGVFKSYFSASSSCILTLLTTTSAGILPQGAPTSPRIFDLSMRLLDREFSRLAESNQGKYSRYADNLFFSGEKQCLGEMEEEIFSWFRMAELNIHKIKIRNLSSQTIVRMLGLNIFESKIYNTRAFKRRLRLAIHHIGRLLELNMQDTPEFERSWCKLQGQIAFARKDTLPQKTIKAYRVLEKRLAL